MSEVKKRFLSYQTKQKRKNKPKKHPKPRSIFNTIKLSLLISRIKFWKCFRIPYSHLTPRKNAKKTNIAATCVQKESWSKTRKSDKQTRKVLNSDINYNNWNFLSLREPIQEITQLSFFFATKMIFFCDYFFIQTCRWQET